MAKSESSDIEVGRMYFRYANHFPGRILSMCNLSSVVKTIDEKLIKRQLNMFKKDIFRHFLECRSFPFSGAHEEDSREDQLWFQIGEHLIRLSIVEWCLVTGLSYGVGTEPRDNKTVDRLWKTYFGGVHRKINVKEFDAFFKELKFEEIDDLDALKIALFYFADIVLNVRKNHCQINFDWLNEVDDIQYFRNRPWGLVSWEMVYDSLDNALFEKDEKFKTTRLKNPDHNIEKYNLYGFTSGVQAWIYEAIGGLPSTWVVKTKKKISRIMQWKPMASSRINFAEVYSFFNDKSRLVDVLQSLEPNSKESSRKYWLTVKDYMPSIPDSVHKHQPSINEMPSKPWLALSIHFLNVQIRIFPLHARTRPRMTMECILTWAIKIFLRPRHCIVSTGMLVGRACSPYMIPPLRRGKNARPIPQPQIIEHAIDMNTSVDINPLRGLEDSSLFAEFDRWFAGDMTMVRKVQHPRSFFQILLGLASIGWLGDELLIPVNLDGSHWVLA
ncbi:hypothetical protein CUMW_173050 [Citrus unshiu]|uniref:DUF1985 domain-containing protein n=1 Tax=Citrus unshiu TaxID=55188 RepID=A0A2H5PWZ7_CITUN|nr:hypothetical protein CUMW_173050 [Citrus unshiu]